MGVQTFEHCSLAYLNLWSENDKSCTEALSGNNQEKKLIALKKSANVFKIARNLQTQYDVGKGLKRYAPVLKILDKVNLTNIKKEPVIEIRKIEKLISNKYGNSEVLSLTTKFLWLKVQSPVLIYDSQAQKALGTRVGDLEDFYHRWHIEYNLKEDEINNACSKLKGLYRYMKSSNEITKEEVGMISSQKWFRERVFDIYLWNIG